MHSLFNPHSRLLRLYTVILLICEFPIHGFNQLWIKNIGRKIQKVPKAKSEFATMLVTYSSPSNNTGLNNTGPLKCTFFFISKYCSSVPLAGFPSGLVLKNPPARQKRWVQSLGWEGPREREMATHSSILAWKIPQAEELAGYSPWSRKESDTTERLNCHHHHHIVSSWLNLWMRNLGYGVPTVSYTWCLGMLRVGTPNLCSRVSRVCIAFTLY